MMQKYMLYLSKILYIYREYAMVTPGVLMSCKRMAGNGSNLLLHRYIHLLFPAGPWWAW